MTKEKQIYAQAKELGACDMLTGKETASGLMKLIFTPKGMEFCTKYNFPDMDTFRSYKGFEAEKNGIYIDTDIKLHNTEHVLLVGDTKADLSYDDPAKSHHVILMHGAKAMIKATNYAVVFVSNAGGEVNVETDGTAKVL